MLSARERADLVHILKMKYFALHLEDVDQMLFTKSVDDIATTITINSRDGHPVIEIEWAGSVVFLESFKSVDDLKTFLEGETAQQYLSRS